MLRTGDRRGSVADLLASAVTWPATPGLAMLLARLDLSSLSGPDLVHAVVAGQRLASWVDATQQSLLAALARPGVAVPIERVLEAARWSAATPGEMWASDEALDNAADPATDPGCANAVAHHAARFASMEVAAALHLSPLAARVRVERALVLSDRMPDTLARVRAGDVDPLRASILAEMTATLPPDLGAVVESVVLPSAGSCTPSQLRARLARTVLHLDPDGAAERAKAARKGRDVHARPESNDLATVSALMGADKARTLMWLLNTMADAAGGADDTRTVGERRIDALTDIIDDLIATGVADIRPIGAAAESNASHADTPNHSPKRDDRPEPPRCDRYRPTSPSGTTPPVCLTVYLAASTLAGHDNWPAELAGHGTITPELARALARAATTARVVAVGAADGPSLGPPGACDHPGCTGDATCGTALDHGHDIYRPPARVADYVLERDRCCRFPGCRMPAIRCDLDHQIPFAEGGSTCPCNLRPLCRGHHLAKTFTGWSYASAPDGTATWTSPLGLRHADPPDDQLRNLIIAHSDDPPF